MGIGGVAPASRPNFALVNERNQLANGTSSFAVASPYKFLNLLDFFFGCTDMTGEGAAEIAAQVSRLPICRNINGILVKADPRTMTVHHHPGRVPSQQRPRSRNSVIHIYAPGKPRGSGSHDSRCATLQFSSAAFQRHHSTDEPSRRCAAGQSALCSVDLMGGTHGIMKIAFVSFVPLPVEFYPFALLLNTEIVGRSCAYRVSF